LKYATGEIVLVVIGILIALQLNNANEKSKLNLQGKIYTQSLIAELKSDLQILEGVDIITRDQQ